VIKPTFREASTKGPLFLVDVKRATSAWLSVAQRCDGTRIAQGVVDV
jgi:hypothetical protein